MVLIKKLLNVLKYWIFNLWTFQPKKHRKRVSFRRLFGANQKSSFGRTKNLANILIHASKRRKCILFCCRIFFRVLRKKFHASFRFLTGSSRRREGLVECFESGFFTFYTTQMFTLSSEKKNSKYEQRKRNPKRRTNNLKAKFIKKQRKTCLRITKKRYIVLSRKRKRKLFSFFVECA